MCFCPRFLAVAVLSACAGFPQHAIAGAFQGNPAAPQSPAFACVVAGTVTARGSRLPGVSVTAVMTDSEHGRATSTGPDGTYRLTLTAPGRYDLTLDLPGFAPAVREIEVPESGCPVSFDADLVLASRGPQPVPELPVETAAVQPLHGPQVAPASGGHATRPPAPGQGQRSRIPRAATLTPEGGGDQVDAATRALLPSTSTDVATESVTFSGNGAQANDTTLFGGGFAGRPGVDAFGLPINGGRDGAAAGLPQGMLGRALVMGGGGPIGFAPGGFRGGMSNANRVRLTSFYSLGGSALNAAPYPLAGTPVPKPGSLSQRVGLIVGGPLGLGKVFDRNRTSFFFNYSGSHSSDAFDSYSTVPTLAERSGDFLALGAPLVDPSTGQPFANNQIPASRLSPAAVTLLNFLPSPNLPGVAQNFHYTTTSTTSADDVNFRFIRNFGRTQNSSLGGMRAAVMGRGNGGPTAVPGNIRNLTIGIHYHRSVLGSPNAFPALSSTAETHSWDVPVNYAFTARGILSFVHARYNRNRTQDFGNLAFADNVAGNAGITGASQDPFDWGVPTLQFSTFSSLRDVPPADRLAQMAEIGDTMLKTKGRHTLRFGGDYRAYFTDSRSDQNAAGSFVFTGLYTANRGAAGVAPRGGYDFADFLLGMPQQATVQYGPGTERFRARSWDLFAQDDWRIASKLTLNLGLRYEFVSPFTEASGRLVTLDVNPAFTAAVPVAAGQTGPFGGALPSTLVRPDYTNFAPRVGVAWRATEKTVVRGGYGINYNAGVYATIAQALAAQPPFAIAATNLGTVSTPLSLSNALLLAGPSTTTNTFGVDPNYRIGRVQIWNLDVQRTFSGNLIADVAFIATRGSNLDLQRAPNRVPGGLRIANVQPFIWETSQATSSMNAVSVRAQKRLTSGFSAAVSYVYSRAYDDASTIGGGTVVVAQNDQDLAAEWGPSSFDQPHRFTATVSYDLPFGTGRRWLAGDGAASGLLSGWQIAANVSVASGLPFTARVVGALADVASGVNGTLRADYTGAPVSLANPTIAEWFNTAAFVLPAPGQFGNAGRNSIRGPATKDVDLSLSKEIRFRSSDRGLNVRLQATNVLNIPQFSAIDTALNSPTFGRVVAVRPMRTVQIVTRFRF